VAYQALALEVPHDVELLGGRHLRVDPGQLPEIDALEAQAAQAALQPGVVSLVFCMRASSRSDRGVRG
jgi:hypothetical protein